MKQKMYLFLQYLLLLAGMLISVFLIHQNILKGRSILLHGETISAITIDNKDRVWVATWDGVRMIENMTVTSFDVNEQSMWTTRIGIDENKQIWVVAGTGVIGVYYPAEIYRFDGNNWVFQEKISSALPNENELPCCDPNDEMAITDSQFRAYSPYLEIGYADRQRFLVDKQGNMWAGTNSGLVHFSPDFHIPPPHLKTLHIFLSSGGYWILGLIFTTLYSVNLLRNGYFPNTKSFILTKGRAIVGPLGYFILGSVGWMLISSLFNMNVVLGLDNPSTFYAVLILNQLVGLVLAILTFRFRLRWIGIGVLLGICLFLLGSILRSQCLPPFLLPFPFTAMGWC